jgi:hypothetical protein
MLWMDVGWDGCEGVRGFLVPLAPFGVVSPRWMILRWTICSLGDWIC